MTRCPSQDWDRYVASMDGPLPVGRNFVGKSKVSHDCGICNGGIPAGEPHRIQLYHDEDGHFMSPDRAHLAGQCLPLVYYKDLGEWLYAQEAGHAE